MLRRSQSAHQEVQESRRAPKAWLQPASLNHPPEIEPPAAPQPHPPRPGVPYLLDRHDVCALTGASYTTRGDG